MDWRVNITEVPLVSRDLTIGLHVPLPRQKVKLFFGERRINHGQRDAVESRVPLSTVSDQHITQRTELDSQPQKMGIPTKTRVKRKSATRNETDLIRHAEYISDIEMFPFLSKAAALVHF